VRSSRGGYERSSGGYSKGTTSGSGTAGVGGDGYVDPGPRSNGWWTNGDGPRSRRPPLPGGGASLCMYIGNLSYRTDEVSGCIVYCALVVLYVMLGHSTEQWYCFELVTCIIVTLVSHCVQSNSVAMYYSLCASC
jgi:hypothetical protein